MASNCKSTFYPRNVGGFSLIELLIVVVIIGILLGIAVPQYTDYMRRAKITDGTAKMSEYRVRLEQYFQDKREYGPASGTCAATPTPDSLYFTYGCVVGNPAETYVLTAASRAGQGLGNTDGDYTFTLTETNTRGTTKFKGTSYASGTKKCWLVNGGEC